VLHQVAAHVIGDDGVRDAVLAQLPGGELRALVARARLVDPDVHRDAPVMGGVDGRRRGAIVHEGQPARVAVRQDIHRRAALARANFFDQRDTVLADAAAKLRVLIRDRGGRLARDADHLLDGAASLNRGELALDRPLQVDGRGARGLEGFAVRFQRRQERLAAPGRRVERGQIHPVARRRADQPRAAQQHLADGVSHLVHGGQVHDLEPVRQHVLVDDLDHARIVGLDPDRAVMDAVDKHEVTYPFQG